MADPDAAMEQIVRNRSKYAIEKFLRRFGLIVKFAWMRETDDPETPCLRATDTDGNVIVQYGDEGALAGIRLSMFGGDTDGRSAREARGYVVRAWADFLSRLNAKLSSGEPAGPGPDVENRLQRGDSYIGGHVSSGEPAGQAPASSPGSADTSPGTSQEQGSQAAGTEEPPPQTSP